MSAPVVARCDAPPVFEFCEHVFDFVALPVERFVVRNISFSVLFGRDTRLNAFVTQGGSEPIGVVPAIRQKGLRFGERIKQSFGALVIRHLSFG